MKRSAFFLTAGLCTLVSGGGLSYGQSTTTSSPGAPPPATAPAKPAGAGQSTPATPATGSGLRGRGPEAVAQQSPDKVVATIGGKPLTAKEALDLIKPLDPQDRKRYESNLPLLVQQIYLELQLADQAAAMKLDQQSPYKEQLQIQRANVLTQAYLAKMAESGAQDPKAYYDSHPADFDQVKLSGILVAFNPPGTPATNSQVQRTEPQAQEKANDLEKKIKAGGDFSALARTDSDNPQSSTRGGELGTFLMGEAQLPPEVKNAIANLQTGQVSEPVRIPGGYYIFKMDSRAKAPFDDQLAKNISQKLMNDRKQIVLKQQLDKYNIQVQDPDFFNTSNAPAVRTPTLARPGETVMPPSGPQSAPSATTPGAPPAKASAPPK